MKQFDSLAPLVSPGEVANELACVQLRKAPESGP
jgi:hypothetical protein